ncbi:uncharacterized protein LOC117917278 isoform X1 [Vitis riparia]|uniref:uncharacterized protein LOC117917278 isoform X1 n=1 Tax=Vitis riparia TaxID=96939 RepID=UPI00155A0E88|nr:uncharacterized protein LOC117917278 isoform X1 [Vitis riparia]
MESSRCKKGSSQAACHCICWKFSNVNPSIRTKNCPDLYPMAIHGIDSGRKNIVLLPMEDGHSHVYELLLKINILKDILYLVGWMIKGIVHCILLLCLLVVVFALSLCCIWEIKWYKYQTIKHIFSHEHEDLVQKGGQWLARKANSCLVVATLIATVAFTTSAAVPGGTKKTALHIFAIAL